MVIFKPVDFQDMLYPVHNLKKDVDLISQFPKLNEFEEFQHKPSPEIPLDKLFKYIVYTYDKKSPYVTQIEDLVERKLEAIQAAGFKPNHNKGFSPIINRLLNCEIDYVNKMIIRYCRFQGKDFPNIMASQEAFHQINLQLLSNIKNDDDDPVAMAKKKADLDKAADEFNDRLNEKARKFLVGDTSQGLNDDLWSTAEDEANNIKITPEDYSQ